jgi:GxxExxY protein
MTIEEFWAKNGRQPEPRDELTERVIGAAIEVHRELRPGLIESMYEEALCHEFDLRHIPYERQVPVDVFYKGRRSVTPESICWLTGV